ncbi:MAG TPA: hypothetical protein VNX68_10390 [Nitrosopumilaceae archaeon]|jgi:hypothetical protein|nr:hypothetical protein [Nitrosopumilaceae archaeon]
MLNNSERTNSDHVINLKERSVLRDVDDVLTQNSAEQKTQTQRTGTKLDHAREVNHKTEMELRQLCEGLDSRLSEIGIVVADAQNYQGKEKVYNFLGNIGMKWGKDKAASMRHDRIQTLNLDNAIKEIQSYVNETITQLGTSEGDYKMDIKLYQSNLDTVLAKQKEAMPKYLSAQTNRQSLESEVQTLEDQLKAGTLDQSERPEIEHKYEDTVRKLQQAQLDEKTYLAIVKEAKEAIPELQKSRSAASDSIQSIHAMRQAILEKFDNYRVILDRATTAMKARARLEMYQSVDPTLNKSIEAITENNVATAGAALEVWAERIKHAAIDPETSQRLLNEMISNTTQSLKDLADAEESAKSARLGGSNNEAQAA